MQFPLFEGDRRKMIILILLGLMVREFFSFWTGHPSDFELWVRLGYAMNHGGDPYGVLPPVSGLSFTNVFGNLNQATIAYLPLWPLLTGLIYALYSLIGLNDRFVYYFLLKQPVILGDVALAYLMFSYVSHRKPGSAPFWVLSLWLFSPFTIIISGIWGMFDSIAICLILTSVMSRTQVSKAGWLGLGIFAKSIPIIYAAPTTMKALKDAWALILALAIPAVLSIATFAIMKWPLSTLDATLSSTVRKGGASMSIWDGFFYLNYVGLIPALTPLEYKVLGILWIPILVICTWLAIRHFKTETDYGLIQILLVCTLIFLIFKAQVTEQYALYLFALAAIDVALWSPKRKLLLIGTMSVAMIYLVMNNYFLVRFLSPIYPGFVDFENGLYLTIGPVRYAVNFLAGTAFTFLNVKYLADVVMQRE